MQYAQWIESITIDAELFFSIDGWVLYICTNQSTKNMHRMCPQWYISIWNCALNASRLHVSCSKVTNTFCVSFVRALCAFTRKKTFFNNFPHFTHCSIFPIAHAHLNFLLCCYIALSHIATGIICDLWKCNGKKNGAHTAIHHVLHTVYICIYWMCMYRIEIASFHLFTVRERHVLCSCIAFNI